MATTFTYQLSGCVLLVPQYVSGIVADKAIVDEIGSKHTQLLDSQEAEIAIYGTLQLASLKQPPPNPAAITVTQEGEGFVPRLIRVSQAAFELAISDLPATAIGINFNATTALPKGTATTLLFGLLSDRIVEHGTSSQNALTGAGLRLVYDKKPWVATISIEADRNNDKQLTCTVNFNINKPTKTDLKLIRDAEKLRSWFEQTVSRIVGSD